MKRGQKILRKSRVMALSEKAPSQDELDSVRWARSQTGERRAFDVLMEAQGYWDYMHRFRKDRNRAKKYAFGDQWSDTVCVEGKQMTEEQYIKEQGNIPLINNHIHRLIKQFLGVYRSQAKEPTCYARDRDEQKIGESMTTLLQYNMQLNQMQEVNARTMQEFLISGLAVQRKWFGKWGDKDDCWTNYVNPNNFFIDNNMRDFRGWDVSCIGEIHEISLQTLESQFAKTPEDVKRLREIYSNARNKRSLSRYGEQFGYSRLENTDFLFCNDPGLCKVIEVWRKESKPRYRCRDYNTGDLYKIEIEDKAEMVDAVNAERLQRGMAAGMPKEEIPLIEAEWMMDEHWYFYYLSPFGHILLEGETPYEHKSHPYVFKAYPFIDCEIHSFVTDIIDQQRYTNRLITLYDWIMRASAKGVLMFPEGCEPDGMSMEDIADEWSRFNGVVFYKPKPGVPMPTQVANNCTQIGITELLNLQLKFFEEITGINGALQGKPGYAGTSAAKYNQETQNATLSLLDMLESFSAFVRDGAMKDVKNIQQHYDPKKIQNIVGKEAQLNINPEAIKDTEFDLAIIESTTTPAYRQMANEILLKLFEMQAISVEMLLEHADFPFADKLLQDIQSKKEQVEQGEMPDGISPEILQQVQAESNPQAMQMLNQAFGKNAA